MVTASIVSNLDGGDSIRKLILLWQLNIVGDPIRVTVKFQYKRDQFVNRYAFCSEVAKIRHGSIIAGISYVAEHKMLHTKNSVCSIAAHI